MHKIFLNLPHKSLDPRRYVQCWYGKRGQTMSLSAHLLHMFKHDAFVRSLPHFNFNAVCIKIAWNCFLLSSQRHTRFQLEWNWCTTSNNKQNTEIKAVKNVAIKKLLQSILSEWKNRGFCHKFFNYRIWSPFFLAKLRGFRIASAT